MTTITINEAFETALQDYILAIQKHIDEDYKNNYSSLYNGPLHPKIEISRGRKWVKLISKSSQTSVFCFVDPSTGDLYKAATWNTPAKGIRSNIHAVNRPLTLGAFYRL